MILATKKAKKKVKFYSNPISVIESLKKNYPDAHCALVHSNPFELLIATILSAQCTDERVNLATPLLFNKFPDAISLSKAKLSDVEKAISSINFFRNKSKNIISCAQMIVDKFHGQVPCEMESLVQLAGVGRKTANVVLGNAFGISSGIVVDTHVSRLAQRLGWVKEGSPEQIEAKLVKIIPKESWIEISHLLISHGRNLCKARKADCDNCFLIDQCPKLLKNK